MAAKDPSIADIIAQFAVKGTVGNTAEQWVKELSQWLEGDYGKLVHPAREPGLHASGLYKTCGRRVMLLEVFPTAEVSLKAGNHLTYDVGHAMHFWWQHRYLGPKGELWGDWECLGCKTIVKGFMPLNCPCGAPWQDAIRYHELEVRDTVLGYVGHSDGIIVDKNGVRRVFEFKTVNPTEYPELRAAKWEHVIQAHAYMRCLGTQEALIVYLDKGRQCDWTVSSALGFQAGAPHVKAFVVPFDPVIWNPIEERIKVHHEAVTHLQQILSAGKRPAQSDVSRFKRVCDGPRCETAKNCPVAKQCFALGAD